MTKHPKSQALYSESIKHIPGGVNSPVRAFKSVGGDPLFIQRGQGSKIYDVDGNEYIDYVCSWGPLILGHSHPSVVAAMKSQVVNGTSYGAPTELELKMARMITEAFPAIDMVRMVNSGTEATMTAIRLARGYTGRGKIVKFAGCYHGHGDSFLIKAGSGALTLGIPTSPGVPNEIASMTIATDYGDLDTLGKVFQEEGDNIAAVIVEAIPGNMGLVPPQPGYMEGLREITEKNGALLIFDEVITGFRVAYGGVQTLTGIEPDLTCLGKIIGGGMPVGAYGGKREIMDQMAPTGPVYQAGTLSGNPMAMAAGLATLEVLKSEGVYDKLEEKAARLAAGLKEAAKEAGVKASFNRVGSMLCTFFTDKAVVDYDTATSSDTDKYARYFLAMQERGIYLAPSQFETAFVSLAHTDEDTKRKQYRARVSDQQAASGRHSLKFTDGPKQQRSFTPHIYYRCKYTEGQIVGRFSARLEAATSFYYQWRQYDTGFHRGPGVMIEPGGRVMHQGKLLVTVPLEQWIRFEIATAVGDRADGKFTMKVWLPGQPVPRTFPGLAHEASFRRLDWVGFSSRAREDSAYYIDDFEIRPIYGL